MTRLETCFRRGTLRPAKCLHDSVDSVEATQPEPSVRHCIPAVQTRRTVQPNTMVENYGMPFYVVIVVVVSTPVVAADVAAAVVVGDVARYCLHSSKASNGQNVALVERCVLDDRIHRHHTCMPVHDDVWDRTLSSETDAARYRATVCPRHSSNVPALRWSEACRAFLDAVSPPVHGPNDRANL